MSEAWTRFVCWLVRHDLSFERTLSDATVKLHCCKCNRKFAYNHHMMALLPWSIHLDEFYERYGRKCK